MVGEMGTDLKASEVGNRKECRFDVVKRKE